MALFCSTTNSSLISPVLFQRKFANQTPFSLKLLILINSVFENSKVSTFPSIILVNSCVQRSHCCSSLSPANEPDKLAPPTNIVFVKGLAKSTSEGGLKTTFSCFGEVNRVKIITDKKTKQPLGFAYVWYSTEDCAQTAVEEMNGKFLDGKFIYVTIAKPGSCKPCARAKPYKF